MKSHGHSPLGSIKDRVEAIGLEHLSVLPHIQYNGTDEPNTFFDLIIGARSQMRGQRAMQGGLAGPRVELCVGNLEMSSVELSLHAQARRTLNG